MNKIITIDRCQLIIILSTLVLILTTTNNISFIQAFIPVPVERFSFTDCQHDFDSNNNNNNNINTTVVSLVGNGILHGRRRHFTCDVFQGYAPHKNNNNNENVILESNHNLEYIQNLCIDGMTIALWLTFPSIFINETVLDENNNFQPIFTIGSTVFNADPLLSFLPGCPGYEVRIAITYYKRTMILNNNQEYSTPKILLSFTDSDRFCRHILVKNYNYLPLINTSSLIEQQQQQQQQHHTVVTFDESSVNIYIDGKILIENAPKTIDPQDWNATYNSIQLFSNHQDNGTFQGNIQQLDIYDYALNESDIIELYEYGIYAVDIPEDDENILVTPIFNDSITRTILLAKNTSALVLEQNSDMGIIVPLYGYNHTTSLLKLAVEVTVLPKHGTITTLDGDPIENNNNYNTAFIRLNSEQTGIDVIYKLNVGDGYYNVPQYDAHGRNLHLDLESFAFRIVAINIQDEIVMASDIQLIPVYVLLIDPMPFNFSVISNQVIFDEQNKSKATIPDITFVNLPNPVMDRVRVDLWTLSGKLSLQPGMLPLVDFDSCNGRFYSAWQCIGDGRQDRTMTFVAVPDDLEYILHHIQYESVKAGRNDKVYIRIHQGSGGKCLHQNEHIAFSQSIGNNFTTLYHECEMIQTIVEVPGFDAPTGPNGISKSQSRLNQIKKIVFWALTMGFVLFVCCGWSLRLPNCLARGRAVDPDDDDISMEGE